MSNKDKNKAAPAGTSKRAQLAAQQAAEAAHKRMMRIVTVIGVVLALVIVSIVVVVLVQNHQKTKKPQKTVTTAQIVPARANTEQTGIVYRESTKNANAPLVDVYLDYQCPGCASAAQVIDPLLEEMADEGSIQLVYHTLHGLDTPLKNDSSYRSAVAATCVANLETDYFPTYSSTIFANQPKREGTGYTDEQLTQTFAASAGITGTDLETFQTCYNEQATKDFTNKIQDALPAEVRATPSFVVNHQVLELKAETIASKETLLDAIKQAAGQA